MNNPDSLAFKTVSQIVNGGMKYLYANMLEGAVRYAAHGTDYTEEDIKAATQLLPEYLRRVGFTRPAEQ